MPTDPILEKPSAVAAAPGWYVACLSVDLDRRSPEYGEKLEGLTADQVEIWLKHIVAWRIDFNYEKPDSPYARSRDLYAGHAWPGDDMATPITLEGLGIDEEIIVKAPDGRFIFPHNQEWDDEQSLREWFLCEERAKAARRI